MSTPPTNPLQRPASPAAGPAMPEPPKVLLFSCKKIVARAMPFVIGPGPDGKEQRALLYAIPDGYNAARRGETGPIPAGTEVLLITTITPDALPYVIEKLRNAGWQGNSFVNLKRGKYDGLGDVDCNLSITVETTKLDKATGQHVPLTDDKGKFRPQMRINFVTPLGSGFAFKTEATDDDLASIDAMLGNFGGGAPASGQQHRTTSSAPTPGAVPNLPPEAAVSDEDIPF